MNKINLCRLFVGLVCLSGSSLVSVASEENNTVGWVWVQYPWVYMGNESGWGYLEPQGDQIWCYHFEHSSWTYWGGDVVIPNPFAVENTVKSLPGSTFYASTERLENWAQSGPFGAARVDTIEYEGISIVIIRRSYTWGMLSSDLSIYVQNGDIWERSLFKERITGTFIDFTVEGDQIIFTAQSGSESRLIMSVSLPFLIQDIHPMVGIL